VAYTNFPIECNNSWIVGIGYLLRFKNLFKARKSDINRMVLSFFGMGNEGEAHSALVARFKSPIETSRSTSCLTKDNRDIGME
jgi:hypothetical protein